MIGISIGFAIVILLALAVQLWHGQKLLSIFRNYRQATVPAEMLPECAVVLCVRGCDPGLGHNLRRLLSQDYPRYHLYVVADNEQDPAVALCREILHEGHVAPAFLKIVPPSPTASIVANHHGTVLPELARNYDILVLVDADVETWPCWLRTLVSPLIDSDLALVYGNRWYMPATPCTGSLWRYIWNFGSVQTMVLYQYPWGGSLAMKRDLALAPEFAATLTNSFGNDTPLYALAQRAGLKMQFHPGVMCINSEQMRWPNFLPWITRQMVYSRLYHPTWPAVLTIGLLSGLSISGGLFVNALNVLTFNILAFSIVTAALVSHWVVWMSFLFQLDGEVARISSQYRQPGRWWTWSTACKIVLSAPLVQILFIVSLLKAIVLRRLAWRGVEYEIRGPFSVNLVANRPVGNSGNTKDSLC